MTDVTAALEAKSDQLNAVDIMAADRVIHIREVRVSGGEQPVWVYFDGDNNRPWKPSKGMLRVLAGAWGTESQSWVGKYACLFFEPSVTYGGAAVGGIRVRALSDIDPKGLSFVLTISRTKRIAYPVEHLTVDVTPYPPEKFETGFAAMVEAMKGGMSLQNVIARCHQTGMLSPDQLTRLEAAAPVEVDGDEEGII